MQLDKNSFNFSDELLKILSQSGEKAAIHRADVDGLVCGILTKKHIKQICLVPIDIGVKQNDLIHPLVGPKISSTIFYLIADLPPFAKCKLYVDHHASNISRKKEAERVCFDPSSPSAAKLLAEALKVSKDEKELIELANATDNLSMPKPTPIKSLDKKNVIWNYYDAVEGCRTIAEFVELINAISNGGNPHEFNKLISRTRKKRKHIKKLLDRITVAPLTIIISNGLCPNEIIWHTYQLGAIVSCLLMKLNYGWKCLISSNPETIENFDLHLLAQRFGGGGHENAAGFDIQNHIMNRQTIINSIKKYVQLEVQIYQIGNISDD